MYCQAKNYFVEKEIRLKIEKVKITVCGRGQLTRKVTSLSISNANGGIKPIGVSEPIV